jgi:hypothetical protein
MEKVWYPLLGSTPVGKAWELPDLAPSLRIGGK